MESGGQKGKLSGTTTSLNHRPQQEETYLAFPEEEDISLPYHLSLKKIFPRPATGPANENCPNSANRKPAPAWTLWMLRGDFRYMQCGAAGKEPTCQCRRHTTRGSIPGWGRSPEGGNSNLL